MVRAKNPHNCFLPHKDFYKKKYSNLDSTIFPVSYSDQITIPVFTQLPLIEYKCDINTSEDIPKHNKNTNFVDASTAEPKSFDQARME